MAKKNIFEDFSTVSAHHFIPIPFFNTIDEVFQFVHPEC